MISSFKISFSLKNTYRVNGIIYLLKSLPVIKKLLPSTLYGSHDLKTIANIFSIILEVAGVFIGKAVYLLLMIVLPLSLTDNMSSNSFLHILVFLTVIGGILNTHMFDTTKDKYYAMVLMRMDARRYTLSNYLYFLIKTAVGFLPFAIAFGIMAGVPLWTCLLIPLFVVSIKCIFSAIKLKKFEQNHRISNEEAVQVLPAVLVVIMLIAAYLPSLLGYSMPLAASYGMFIVSTVLGIVAFKYIMSFQHYRQVYKEILTADKLARTGKAEANAATQKQFLNKLYVSADQTSSKTGYAYFNDIFIKRHRRLLTKSAKRITIIELIILVAAVVGCLVFPEAKAQVNDLILNNLPYFLFIMYFINRGKTITQAMFMNCDHSMLTYRFYRQPKVIVSLFAARLKSVTLISLTPAAVIACGLPLLLFVTGGTHNPFNYVILFVSILAMAVFFSVHNMVLYYLLQPYTMDLEMKSPMYGIINYVTYMVCYLAIGKTASTFIFGAAVSAFCIIYVAVALVLAYKLAPKIFKLRG